MKELIVKIENHTAWITLNRPNFSNAFSVELIQDLVKNLYDLDANSDVRSIVITGEGKHFCAGGDVKSMQNKDGMFAGEPDELRERYKFGIQQIPRCFESLSTPVVAMINGAAIGAGLDLACMCDIRIASEHAKFGETFASLGLVPGDGGTYFLQRVVGFAKAMELTLTGEVIDAQEALKINLVTKLMKADKLEPGTRDLVNKINSLAPTAVRMSKRSLIHAYRNDLASSLDLLSAYQGITQRTSDHFDRLENIFSKK